MGNALDSASPVAQAISLDAPEHSSFAGADRLMRALLLGLPRLANSLVAATLEEVGIDAIAASDMAAASAVVSEDEIDVCIVDLDRFGATAVGEIRHCVERWPAAATIGIAGRPSSARTDAIVRRPFGPPQLLAAVELAADGNAELRIAQQ
jgi:DNA-binding response OmpR family regulator